MKTEEYIENLESALIDILYNNTSPYELRLYAEMSEERAKEIMEFGHNVVAPTYRRKHNLD